MSPIAAIQAGQYLKVPVLAGNTRDEGKLFPTLFPLAGGTGSGRLLNDAHGVLDGVQLQPERRAADDARAVDPAGLPADRRRRSPASTRCADKLNQIFFGVSRDSVLNALKTQQSNIWYYRFDWDELPAPFNEIYGAAHGFDLPFAFGNFGPSLYCEHLVHHGQPAAAGWRLSDAMMRSIGAFARNGDPNNAASASPGPRGRRR